MPIITLPSNFDNGKYHYTGLAPFPYPLVIGNTWRELNVSNNLVQYWVWNGTYWISHQIFSQVCCLINNSQTATVAVLNFSPEANFNIFAKTFKVYYTVNTTSTVSNFFRFNVAIISTTGVTTNIANIETIGSAANTPRIVSQTLGFNINVAATNTSFFRMTESRIAGSLSRISSSEFLYRLARV